MLSYNIINIRQLLPIVYREEEKNNDRITERCLNDEKSLFAIEPISGRSEVSRCGTCDRFPYTLDVYACIYVPNFYSIA